MSHVHPPQPPQPPQPHPHRHHHHHTSHATHTVNAAENAKKVNLFDAWIMDCLIRLYVKPQQHVGEFFCGNGIILSRLMVDILSPPSSSSSSSVGENPFEIGSYIGIDHDTSTAKNRWITKDQPFTAEFISTDVLTHAHTNTQTPPLHLSSSSLPSSSLDVIFSFKGLSRMCSSLSGLRQLLYQVSRSLKLDGLFVGTMIDPQVVWYKITKKDREAGGVVDTNVNKKEKGIGVSSWNSAYRLDFPHLPRSGARFDQPFAPTMKFYFQYLESVTPPPSASSSTPASAPQLKDSKLHPPSSSYLISVATLRNEAQRMGLAMIHMQNNYSSIDVFSQTFDRLGIYTRHSPDQITPMQADLFSLYTTFAFRKVAEPPAESTTLIEPNNTSHIAAAAAGDTRHRPMEI